MIRILNAEALGYSPQALSILEEIGRVDQFTDLDNILLYDIIPEYQVLITRLKFQINSQMLDRASQLHTIVTATTGLNHIDLDYAKQKEIHVLSLYGEKEFLRTVSSTAEHTWALLLSLVRHIPLSYHSVLSNKWDRDRYRGNQLQGKQLGILGLGRIGQKVAQYGLSFGIEDVCLCSSMADLLKESNILSIHVPFNSTTYHLLSASEISQLPSHSIIINTARGAILNEHDVVQALENGHLRGVAIDVLENEHQLEYSPLLQYAKNNSNIIITPHIGGATFEAMETTEIFMATKLQKYLKEKMR